MSIGWPKANGRLVVCAWVCAGRVRALLALPLRIAAGQLLLGRGNRGDLLWIALLIVSSKRRLLGLDFGRESSLCRARRRKAHEATRDSQTLRTKHRRTGGAPGHLDRHAGQTPSRFAEQSRAAGQRAGLATAGAQIWWPYSRHQAQAARPGARPPAQAALSSIAGGIDKSSPRQRNQQAVAGSAARGEGAGRWLSTPGHGLWQSLPRG